MASTVKTLSAQTPKTGLDATACAADPPVKADMIALPNAKEAAPLAIDVLIVGDGSTERTLTGAHWFGWHAQLDVAVNLGPVLDGYDLTIKSSKPVREVLELVAGTYSHLGLGLGTLSGGSVDLHVYPLELQE